MGRIAAGRAADNTAEEDAVTVDEVAREPEAAAAVTTTSLSLPVAESTASSAAAAGYGKETTAADSFEGSAWEVELSDKVVRWFRKRSRRNSDLCEMVVDRLRVLAKGFWSFPTNQKILKGVPKGIHL